VTDPANPGQPYGGQPGQPYGGQPGPPGQPGQSGHYGPPADQSGHYGPPAPQYGGPQPGGPYGGAGEAPAPNPYAPVPPPPQKKTGRVVGIIVGAVVLLLILCVGGAVLVFNNAKHDAANAKVGNCLEGEKLDSTTAKQVNNIKIVDCNSSTANYKVVGVVPNKTEAEFDANDQICKDFPTAESALWQGTQGKSGSVLCLEPIKK
jgi:hypothetical protein